MNRSLLGLFLCLPLLAVDPSAGPSLPPIKGVQKASTAPFWVAYGMKAVLRDVPGAVVVVEDSMPEFLPYELPRLSLFQGNVRLKSGDLKIDRRIAPLPDFLNPGVVISGGNVVQRSYNMGGVSF